MAQGRWRSGAVFISGVLFLILSLTRIRSWIVDAIPLSQKMAISAGIGLFLGIIALKEAGIIAANPDTLVTLGDLKSPATLLACAGFIVMVALDRLAVPGAIIIAILATAWEESTGALILGGTRIRLTRVGKSDRLIQYAHADREQRDFSYR